MRHYISQLPCTSGGSHLGGAEAGLPLVDGAGGRVIVRAEAAVGLPHRDLHCVVEPVLAVRLLHELLDVLEAEVEADDVRVRGLVGEVRHHVLGHGPGGLGLLAPLHRAAHAHGLEVEGLVALVRGQPVAGAVHHDVAAEAGVCVEDGAVRLAVVLGSAV